MDRKKRALSQLISVQCVFRYGLAAFGMMHDQASWHRFVEHGFRPNGHDFAWQPLRDMLKGETERNLVFADFYKSLCRTTIRESLEVVDSYCHETHQAGRASPIRTEPWIEYIRTIRNCVAHDFKLSFKSRRVRELLSIGPLEWSLGSGEVLSLTMAMDGLELALKYIDVPFIRSMDERLLAFLKHDLI